MRIARNSRNLSSGEIHFAAQVFEDSLPEWGRISITDGLGPIPGFDNPFTNQMGPTFTLNLGPDVYPDATLTTNYLGFGTYRNILIHEMTHVWQYIKVTGWYFAQFGPIVGSELDTTTQSELPMLGMTTMLSNRPTWWRIGLTGECRQLTIDSFSLKRSFERVSRVVSGRA
jgi:hypothetical protein